MKPTKNIAIFFLASALAFSSCIDTELESVVEYKNHYQTIPDADNAIIGLYGSFMKLAEQTVVLGELRGDLMDVTMNSSVDLQQINTNTPSADNKYVDMTNYYTVIQNCNDIMAGFDEMLANNRMTRDEYAERYSDVIAIRCWTYLQLGLQFGKIVYVTEPTITVTDAKQLENQPKIGLDELLPKLIACMEAAPTLALYQNSSLVQYKLDGYDLKNFFINKRLLLADLYLWNNDYMKAATQYRTFLATDEDKDATANNIRYRCGSYAITGGGDSDSYFQIGYDRYKEDDINAYHNTWSNMFSLPADNSVLWRELIWTISYDKAYEPYYPFIELFSNQGHGKYQLKPSDYAVKDLWEAQVQKNKFVFDGRGRNSSFKLVNGEYVVQKYLYDYDPAKPYEKGGRWFLYRSALVLLRYAEAANRCGYPKLAYAILNNGIAGSNSVFYWGESAGELNNQAGWGPGKPYPSPFYFDGRFMDTPNVRAPWRNFTGIRDRASLKPKTFPKECTTTQDSIQFMEKVLIEEAALECGFEGHRWEDLIRVARRMNKEGRNGNEYLQETIRPKYMKSGEAMPDYSSESKWYLSIK